MAYNDDACCVCTNKKCFTFLLIIGCLLAIGGIIGLIVSPIASKSQVQSRIPLTENSFAASQWIDPPYVITMQFWLFNTTNADEVQRGTARPSVAEKGPYTYKQKNQKSQVVYGTDDDVSYIETNYFYFDQNRSCSDCFETDLFTVPNAVYTTVAQYFHNQTEDMKRVSNLILMILGEKPFITKKVSELLFQGFEDQLFTVARAMEIFIPHLVPYDLPKVFQYFPKNNTNDGRYEIWVGNSDVRKMGMIKSWNGKRNLTWWSGEANEIYGTDAQLFPPYINRNDLLPIFVSDMCRSSSLKYVSDIHENGLQAYRFILPEDQFDWTKPNNKGFCVPTHKYYPSQSEHCLPPGLLDLTLCRGSPMIFSLPHFLYAPDEVVKSIDGLHPNQEQHQPTWDIQPTFGAAIAVQTKFQINVPLYPDAIFMQLKLINPTIIPLFWFNASAISDPGTADYLYTNIVILQTVGYAATLAVMLFGLLFIAIAVGCCCRQRMKSRTEASMNGRNNAYANRALIEDTDDQYEGRWSSRKH